MAARVVKLKPEKTAPGPVILVRRSKPGTGEVFPFIVGGLDEKGCEDFRGLQEYQDYGAALKAANDLGQRLRLPVRFASGLEPETKPEKAHRSQPKAVPAHPAKPDRRVEKALEADLDTAGHLSAKFNLPDISEKFDDEFVATIASRSVTMHRLAREQARNNYAEQFGNSNDHAVAYSQKQHDLIQWQIEGLVNQMVCAQAIVYAQLEAALKRIDELERTRLSVEAIDAQVLDDDRTIELSFGTGEQRQVASFKWPTVIYRGVHRRGQQYEAGDMVSHQGSGWIAERATSAEPGTPDSGFKLAIKRGKDGKS